MILDSFLSVTERWYLQKSNRTKNTKTKINKTITNYKQDPVGIKVTLPT